MGNTWNYNLMDLLSNARLGKKEELNEFLKKYSPFAVANEDCSALLVLRRFKVQYWKDERRVLGCAPEDEHFQWGIAVNIRDKDGGWRQCDLTTKKNMNLIERNFVILRFKNVT